MKTILVTASGGPSTLSFSRSLRDADPERTRYRLIGTDCDAYNIHRSEVDVAYLCPKASDPAYIPFLVNLIKKEGIEFIHSQPEIEALHDRQTPGGHPANRLHLVHACTANHRIAAR